MKIALIGYGKMGREIEKVARERGHEIVAIIDFNTQDLFESSAFKSADVAIEFSVPSEALNNYKKCFAHTIPVVSGTTGWLEHFEEVKKACNEGQTFFYASNFSLGVNIFFALNKKLAQMMNHFPSYGVRMQEIHHTQKLDAPSGTAITLAEGIIDHLDRKTAWELGINETRSSAIAIEALREGDVNGIHDVCYYSDVDEITIKHSATSRKGFALGAVCAAEFTANNKGLLSMDQMLDLK